VKNERENSAISNQSLHELARIIPHEKVLDLATELGYVSEVRQFRKCHPNDTRRSTMNMLQHWCEDQLRINTVDEVIAMLSHKLMAAKCVDAAFKLQGITAAVISSKDLMKLAKAIPPDNYQELGLELNITLY
jgi:hypothetical protein